MNGGVHARGKQGRAGLINEQHTFQSQLIKAVNPNLPFLHREQTPYHNVFVRSALPNETIVTCSNRTLPCVSPMINGLLFPHDPVMYSNYSLQVHAFP